MQHIDFAVVVGVPIQACGQMVAKIMGKKIGSCSCLFVWFLTWTFNFQVVDFVGGVLSDNKDRCHGNRYRGMVPRPKAHKKTNKTVDMG